MANLIVMRQGKVWFFLFKSEKIYILERSQGKVKSHLSLVHSFL